MKRIICILLFLVLYMFLSACAPLINGDIAKFDFDQDSDVLNEFSPETLFNIEPVYFGTVDTAEAAAQNAENFFIQYCDDDKQRPFTVGYDAEDKVWHVSGYVSKDAPGGSIHAYIAQEDGRLLACWGDE